MQRTIVVLSIVGAVIATLVRTSNALTVSSGDVYAVGAGPRALATADLDHDGLADLVTLNGGASTASVLLGDAAGGFDAAGTSAVVASPTAVALGDINGDAKTDLVTVGSASGNISIRFGDATGAFPTVSSIKSSSPSLTALALGDL